MPPPRNSAAQFCAILRRPLRPLHQVEEPRKYPRGKALAVQQHDDIIAANHHAKALGVRKRTAPAEARSIFSKAGVKPGLVHVPTEPTAGRVTYALYRRHSARLAALWRRLATGTPALSSRRTSSLDEVWIDTGTSDAAAAQRLAEALRRASRDELGFDVSVGVGRNSPSPSSHRASRSPSAQTASSPPSRPPI